MAVSAITRGRIRDCLYNVVFPADQPEIIAVAMCNGYEDAARVLRMIPPETYANIAEVLASVDISDNGASTVPTGAARTCATGTESSG